VCNKTRSSFDPFYDISLPFPGEGSNLHRRTSIFPSILSGDLARCTLDDCLREFSKDEVLDGENMTECSYCREKRVSVKTLQVFRFPRVLVIHLKRFGNSKKKVRTSVAFPMTNLDVGPLAHARLHSKGFNPIYDLYAAIDHSGRLNCGHYTASCVNLHSRSWYKFNDQRVSSIDESKLDEASAYILFYRIMDG